jgi:hypothetical protein
MSRIKKQILSKLKEYGSKMGTNTMGGDDYTSKKKGGLRDFDGYDNVQYNKDMPQDESVVTEACWKGYKQVGGKLKNGKQVPNCVPESISEGMFSAIDQIKQDSKNVRDFVKNVFKDREFKKMSNDKDFIKYLKSIYEGVNEDGHPQNWMSGRTSDYHTALRGKNKDYSGGTNFKKKNHGQPDIDTDDEDQETNQLSNQQLHVKAKLKVAESGKDKSE